MLSQKMPVCMLSEVLYADDLVLMSETIEGLWNKYLKWKEAFESKVLRVNLGKTKVLVRCGITKDGLSKSTVDTCWVCNMLCVLCGKWVHGIYARVKVVTPMLSRNLTCRQCEGKKKAVEQEEKLCDEVETVSEFMSVTPPDDPHTI